MPNTPTNRVANPAYNTQTLSANLTLVAGGGTAASSQNQLLTASGGNRNAILPAVADSYGLIFNILNAGGSNNIVVKQPDTTTTLATLTPNNGIKVACDGTAWVAVNILTYS